MRKQEMLSWLFDEYVSTFKLFVQSPEVESGIKAKPNFEGRLIEINRVVTNLFDMEIKETDGELYLDNKGIVVKCYNKRLKLETGFHTLNLEGA